MKTYKILSVTPFFPPDKGGLSYHVQNLNIRLIDRGNSVYVITPKRLGHEISETNTQFKQLSRMNSIFLPGWPYPTLRSVSFPIDLGKKIESIMKNGDFDLVHVHGHHYPISWLTINSASKQGIPTVLTLHGMYALNPNVLGGKSMLEDCFNKYIFTKILSKTKGVIGLTNSLTAYAKQFGKESIKYFTIPNGVNTHIYKMNLKRKREFREKYGIGQEKTVILFCGRFEKGKGIIEFANAIKNVLKNNNVGVIIIGQGALESSLRSILANTNGVHILKWMPPEHIHEIYIASDIFAIPSRFEALPLTIIEAMNAGLHIVYTPVGGIPEILGEYSLKTVLQEVSVNEIQKVLTDLILNFSTCDTSDSLRYAQKFDWDNIAVDTNKAFDECIVKNKR